MLRLRVAVAFDQLAAWSDRRNRLDRINVRREPTMQRRPGEQVDFEVEGVDEPAQRTDPWQPGEACGVQRRRQGCD
jgi:hypothetical protein